MVQRIRHDTATARLLQITIKQAVAQFEAPGCDALAVVDTPETGRVIGLLTEQYLQRHYPAARYRRRRHRPEDGRFYSMRLANVVRR